MVKQVLTDTFSEPLNGVKTAKIDINTGDGNLTIDQLTGDGQALATGVLQYLENQERPKRTLISNNSQATLTLRRGSTGQRWFRFPWQACNGATDWHIHLNPTVSLDITAHSDGGNIGLDLAGMAITRVMADTEGGNIDVVLPDNATDLDVTARTGAGNVIVRIPNGIAARIQTTTGLGKAIVDPQFSSIDDDTYQSPDFDNATHKIELTLKSGAGNVIVETN